MNTLRDYLISFDPDDDPDVKDDGTQITPVTVPPKPPTGPAMEALLSQAGIPNAIVQRNRRTNTYFVEWHQDAQPAAQYSAALKQALGERVAIARTHEVRRMDGSRAFTTVDFSLS